MNTDHEIAAVQRRLGSEVKRAGKRVFDSAAKDAAAALASARQSDGYSVAAPARRRGSVSLAPRRRGRVCEGRRARSARAAITDFACDKLAEPGKRRAKSVLDRPHEAASRRAPDGQLRLKFDQDILNDDARRHGRNTRYLSSHPWCRRTLSERSAVRESDSAHRLTLGGATVDSHAAQSRLPASALEVVALGRVPVVQRPDEQRAKTATPGVLGAGGPHGGHCGARGGGGRPRAGRARAVARRRQSSRDRRETATPGSPGHDPHSPQRDPPLEPTRTQSLSRAHSLDARRCASRPAAVVGFCAGVEKTIDSSGDLRAPSVAAQPEHASNAAIDGSEKTIDRSWGCIGDTEDSTSEEHVVHARHRAEPPLSSARTTACAATAWPSNFVARSQGAVQNGAVFGGDDLEGSAAFFFQRWSEPVREALVADDPHIDAPTVMQGVEAQYLGMVPKMSDPGFFAPLLRVFVLNGAIYIAAYLALSPRGYSTERVWSICDDATRRFCAAFGTIGSKLVNDAMFSPIMADYLRWEGGRTGHAAIGDWVYAYVQTDAEQFDYGVDFDRCALRELAATVGAEAFAPYVCLGDIPLSDAFGLGLHRTETLAQGGSRCDFRFKRGAATDVKKRLPIVAT